MLQTDNLAISALTAEMHLDSFTCGNADMDDWLIHHSMDSQNAGSANTFICQREGRMVGFYSLSAHTLQKRTLPDETRDGVIGGNIPVILLGRLGVSEDCSKQGIGRYLVDQAKDAALRYSQLVAARFLYVQAKNNELIAWYSSQGFFSMPKNHRNMVFDLLSLHGN